MNLILTFFNFIFYFLSSFLCGDGITTFLVSFLAEYVLFLCHSAAAVFFFEYCGDCLLLTALISSAEGFVFSFFDGFNVFVEDYGCCFSLFSLAFWRL